VFPVQGLNNTPKKVGGNSFNTRRSGEIIPRVGGGHQVQMPGGVENGGQNVAPFGTSY